MTIEYLPVGVACNLSCNYCYQEGMRDAGNINVPRNWEKVKEQILRLNSTFTVFGGEPLLAPIEHLDEVWKFGFEKFGRNGVQTNGTLITPEHIELFQKYRVDVGISVDGPGDLNSARTCGNDTLAATNHTLEAIRTLCSVGQPPSLIVTMNKANSKFPEITDWLDDLLEQGVRYFNFHILEVEKGMESLALSEEENISTFLQLYEWCAARHLRSNPFCDIYDLLTQENAHVSCVWNHCDPATTAAVQGISPDGVMSNCGRTNKDGVDWVKADTPGFERYLLLKETPQSVGGCKGCKYFIFCKGQCPGTAIEGDWRNRTVNCRTWYTLFERIEADIIQEGKIPISINCTLKKEMENRYVSNWSGEHGDNPHGDNHGDGHGDSPHGDSHGDSGVPIKILNEPPQL